MFLLANSTPCQSPPPEFWNFSANQLRFHSARPPFSKRGVDFRKLTIRPRLMGFAIDPTRTAFVDAIVYTKQTY